MDGLEETRLMEAYKIRNSIEDVIAILDSAPIQPDLAPERNLVQLTNRIPIAHLAIERGLKAIIKRANGNQEEIHSLGALYETLKRVDSGSANLLAEAFDDAVNFFGYNPNRSGFEQFRSLEEYFSKTGGRKAFDALRYWAIGDPGTGESAIQFISPPIHREILCALASAFRPRPQTVSQRVELQVMRAMFDSRDLAYSTNDFKKKQSVEWYINWLFKDHTTRRKALTEAVDRDFSVIDGDEIIAYTLREAWKELNHSKDPAVRYFIHTLTYMPEGSQPQDPRAIPCIDWLNKEHTRVTIGSPSGKHLGIAEKLPDGAWGFWCLDSGSGPESGVARALKDAKNYMVNNLTFLVTVNVNDETKQMRIFGNRDYFPEQDFSQVSLDPEEVFPIEEKFQLEFWDEEHGLNVGDVVIVSQVSEGEHKFVLLLEGNVTAAEELMVKVEGIRRTATNDEVGH